MEIWSMYQDLKSSNIFVFFNGFIVHSVFLPVKSKTKACKDILYILQEKGTIRPLLSHTCSHIIILITKISYLFFSSNFLTFRLRFFFRSCLHFSCNWVFFFNIRWKILHLTLVYAHINLFSSSWDFDGIPILIFPFHVFLLSCVFFSLYV